MACWAHYEDSQINFIIIHVLTIVYIFGAMCCIIAWLYIIFSCYSFWFVIYILI